MENQHFLHVFRIHTYADLDIIFHQNKENENTNLFSKLTQMLPKKAKMTFSWFAVGGTLIRTRAFRSHGRFLVAKKFYKVLVHLKKISDALKLRKIHFLSLGNSLKRQINFEKLIYEETEGVFSPPLQHQNFF